MTGPRPHGRAKYNAERCRCTVCRRSNTDYENNRNRQRAYGRRAYVDAAPVREHVRSLMAAGMGWRRIALAAGVPISGLSKLLYGVPNRGRPPSKQVRPTTADRILAVTLQLAPAAHTGAIGTHRRVQALVALGYSQRRLAAELGMSGTNFSAMLTRDRITVATATAVRHLYDRLSLVPAKPLSARDTGVTRARRYAEARGWAPPLAWDDDTIDDPASEPTGVRDGHERRHGGRKLPEYADLLDLLDQGATIATIADRYHVAIQTVEQALYRHRARERAA